MLIREIRDFMLSLKHGIIVWFKLPFDVLFMLSEENYGRRRGAAGGRPLCSHNLRYYNIILKAILTLSLPKSTTSVRIRPTRRAPYPPLLFLGLSVLWGDSRARPWLESKGATTIRSVVYHINEYYELTEPADTRNGAVNAICSRRAHPPPSTLPHE